MWNVTLLLWFFVWFFPYAVPELQLACTILIGVVKFLDMFTKRLRLLRIERALSGIWTWWYIPFMVFIFTTHLLIVFLACSTLYAASAFTIWPLTFSSRRFYIFCGGTLGFTLYVLEYIAWKHFFAWVRL